MQKTILNSFIILAASSIIASCSKSKESDPCANVSIAVTATKTDATANDGSISATATGSTGFSYKINNGTFQTSGNFTGLAGGDYTITAKDVNGCTGSESFTISYTKTYYLAKASWKFSTATANGINVSAALQACQKDNILTFQINGNGTMDEGTAKCNAADPQSIPFTWNFTTSESVLHISATLFTGGNNDFNVVSISDTQLVASQTISGQNIVVTFVHP